MCFSLYIYGGGDQDAIKSLYRLYKPLRFIRFGLALAEVFPPLRLCIPSTLPSVTPILYVFAKKRRKGADGENPLTKAGVSI